MRIVQTIDFDNKTIIPGENNISAPGAEIEVLDTQDNLDTDTHYYESSTKWLKHRQTGAVWQADIGQMKERAAPRHEELIPASMQARDVSIRGDKIHFLYEPQSAVSYRVYGYELVAIPVSGYANAKEFNESNKTHTYSTPEYFADILEGKPKILATTFELPYPVLPFTDEGVLPSILSFDDYGLRFDIEDRDKNASAMSYDKTFHAKITLDNGDVLTGSVTVKNHTYITVETFVPGVDKHRIRKIEYSMDPFVLEWFKGRATFTPENISKEFDGM